MDGESFPELHHGTVHGQDNFDVTVALISWSRTKSQAGKARLV